MIKNSFWFRNLIGASVAVTLLSPMAFAKSSVGANRKEQILKAIYFGCLSNSDVQLPEKAKKDVCRCVQQEHAKKDDLDDLKIIELNYKKQLKYSEPIDDGLSILLQDDAEIADECLKMQTDRKVNSVTRPSETKK